jgi:hypothetical protein
MTVDYGQTYFDNPEIWSIAAWQWCEADLNRARIAAEWLPSVALEHVTASRLQADAIGLPSMDNAFEAS